MPDQATIPTSPPPTAETASHARRLVTPSSSRPGSATDVQSGVGWNAARHSAASFATAFASALQDDGNAPTPPSGDKPAVALVGPEEPLDQPINAMAAAQSGKRAGDPTSNPFAAPARPDAPTSAVITLLRDARPARPKTSPLPAASETLDPPALATTEALVALPTLPPHHLSKQASSDGITAPSSNETTPPAAKAELVLHDPDVAPPTIGVAQTKPGEHQPKPFIADPPLFTPGISSINPVPLNDALNVPAAPNVGIGIPAPATRPQAPEKNINAGSPADQVMPAIIRLSSADGGRRISLQLTPTDLGLVDIRIDQPKDGPVIVTLTVQHPRTLELLQRDFAQLSQTLDRAGLSGEGRQVSLSLVVTHIPAAPPDPGSPPGQQAATGMQDQGSGSGNSPYANPNSDMGQRSRHRGDPDFTVNGPQADRAVQPSVFIAYQADHRAGLNITA